MCVICDQCFLGTKCHSKCKIYGYWYRHKGLLGSIIEKGVWTKAELNTILYKLFYEKVEVINDIVPSLDHKTLQQLMELLSNELIVRGTTKLQVRVKCFTCGKALTKNLALAMRERSYCSEKCRDVYKSKFLSGENSPFYKSVDTFCVNCGKSIKIKPYKRNNNCFCSQECYYQYRSKHYCGKNHPMYGKTMTIEHRKMMSQIAVNTLCEGKMKQTDTVPHKLIDGVLDKDHINYQNEYNMKYYSLDIYLSDFQLGIEIMGDYWHCSPIKYAQIPNSKIQSSNIVRDKRKHTYVKKYYGFEILYLWESDIKSNIDLCDMLIHQYIKQNGKLDDYNSFNYYICNNELLLKDNIIYPYFIKPSVETTGCA